VAALLLACGGSSGPDAGVDAFEDSECQIPDPTDCDIHTGAGVTVTARGAAVPGADVVFHDRDGAVLDHVTTDGSGSALYDQSFTGTITVGAPDRPLVSVFGLGNDNYLALDLTAEPRAAGFVEVQFESALAGATAYAASNGCDGASTADPGAAVLIPVTNRCLGSDGRFDVVGVAIDEAAGEVLAIATVTDLTPATGDGVVAATLPPWNPTPSPYAVTIQDRFEDLDPASLTVAAGEVRDGVAFLRPPAAFDPAVENETAFAHDSAFAESIELLVSYELVSGEEPAASGTSRLRELSSATEKLFDFDVAALPRLEDVIIDSSVPARPQLRWRAGAEPPEGGMVRIVLVATAAGETPRTWILIAPPGDSELTAPDLPAALLDRWLPDGESEVTATVTLIEHSEILSYWQLAAGVLALPALNIDGIPLAGAGSFQRTSAAAAAAAR
jgi:hypothetical protein